MKITTLRECPEFYQETLALIEKNFHYKTPWSFATDFAPLMVKENFEHNYILLDEGKVVGHVGVNLKRAQGKKLVFLGGIAIDEAYQGQGLFKKLFEYVLGLYEKNCAAFFLWSDLHALYEKFRFEAVHGLIQTGDAEFRPLPAFEESRFDKLSVRDFLQLQELYKNLACDYDIIERDPEDWERIKKITSTKLFLKRDSQGAILSYFCLGKGLDLSHIIHEYGWKDKAQKTQLLKELSPFKLWLPACEKTQFPDSYELILALVRSRDFFPSDRFFISGLDSI